MVKAEHFIYYYLLSFVAVYFITAQSYAYVGKEVLILILQNKNSYIADIFHTCHKCQLLDEISDVT